MSPTEKITDSIERISYTMYHIAVPMYGTGIIEGCAGSAPAIKLCFTFIWSSTRPAESERDGPYKTSTF